MRRGWLVLVTLTACVVGDRIEGNVPIGGTAAPAKVSAETFLRRAFADLHGVVPSTDDPLWRDNLALLAGGLTPDARGTVALRLIAAPAYADALFDEIAMPIFSPVGGIDGAYLFLLYYVDELIGMASDPTQKEQLEQYRSTVSADLNALRALPGQLSSGAIDEQALVERVASSMAALVLSGGDAYAQVLFRQLLGREAARAERRNAAAMAQVAVYVDPAAPPAGVVLRREGKTLDDLARILVESDNFLEARVRSLVQRLLGRAPTTPETWALFDALRNARKAGDFKGGYHQLLRTILASDEYVTP